MNSMFARNVLYRPVQLLRGEAVIEYLAEFKRTEWFATSEIESLQRSRIEALLKYAYENVPHYRVLYDRVQIRPEDFCKLEDLRLFPTINKNDLQRDGKSFKSKEVFRREQKKTTGGSTGQAVTVVKTPSAIARARAAMYRGYSWYGIDIGDRQARLWGVPITVRDRLRYKVIDFLMNRIRLSAFKFREAELATYLQQLERFRPKYIYGYVSMLVQLAIYVRKVNYDFKKRVGASHCVATSEVLGDLQRRTIEEAFQCRVQNEYGCGEVGPIAYECPDGSLHVNMENVYVELQKINDYSDSYEIIITELNNKIMPLIRYRIGDMTHGFGKMCNCGRGLITLKDIYGREYDFLVLKDGTRFHGEQVMYIFEGLIKRGITIDGFQVEQKKDSTLEIRLVLPSRKNADEVGSIVDKEFEKHLGELKRKVFFVEEIRREASGKTRIVKNNLL